MSYMRSFLFGILFYGSVPIFGTLYLPLLLLPSSMGLPFFRAWLRLAVWFGRRVAGMRYDVVLAEGAKMPDGPVIFAAKHQSAWETLAFNVILPNPVFVLKRELKFLPFFGWYLDKMRMIAVDRSAGASAMRGMLDQAKRAMAAGHSIVIYPQGTRVSTGVKAPYHPGVFALYKALKIPVIPIALNSGRLWPRKGIIKKAGTITVSILPEIGLGLDRNAFMAQLEHAIEEETLRLEAV